jgi:hypothetical protein
MKAIEIYGTSRGVGNNWSFYVPRWQWLYRLLFSEWFFPNASFGAQSCEVEFAPRLWKSLWPTVL